MTLPRARTSTEKLGWVLGTWFGCGLVPIAPGTVGTIGALPLYYAVRGHGTAALLALVLVVTCVAIWSAGVVAGVVGRHDPQIVVIDEVAGVLVPLAIAPPTVAGVVVSVVLFRIFDMTKPFPARAAERLPRGYGIVLDDTFAGAWAAAFVLGLAHLGVLG